VTFRVLLVGSAEERARLRARLGDLLHIVGEFPNVSAAHASGIEADAILSAPNGAGSGEIYEPLTARELEVLGLLADGLSNKAIAARLHISDQTVKFHVSSICGKLGAANRTDAVRRAIRTGLIAV
jgi:DNA-binding NarL/FixJ family response regulator